MALVECPECGGGVSSSADACPSCAFPIHAPLSSMPAREPAGAPMRGPTAATVVALDTVKGVAARLVLGAFLVLTAIPFESPPALIGGLLVAGSSFFLWRKAKKAATMDLDGGQSAEQMQEFLLEAEDRQLRAIADFEEQAGQRLTDLEERIDFHERLLIKSRQQGAD